MDSREPEWTAEDMSRKKGSTTFKQCGWCAHAGCGSYRYSCMLSGNCDLLKSHGDDVKFDTTCKVMDLGKEDVLNIIRSKEYEIKNHQEAIKTTKDEIKVLKKLRPEKKPPLPDSRSHDYYEVGDIVFVFHEDKWNRGKVVPGYRHHDGCVSYVLDHYPNSKGGWGCGVQVPCILKEWECDYFREHKLAFEKWLSLSDRVYNGKKLPLDKYFEAMSHV